MRVPRDTLGQYDQEICRDILVAVDEGAYVSAKSLTKLLAMGCRRGQTLTFIAQPDTDAVAGLEQIIDAVQQGLGEEVEAVDLVSHQHSSSDPVCKYFGINAF